MKVILPQNFEQGNEDFAIEIESQDDIDCMFKEEPTRTWDIGAWRNKLRAAAYSK